MDFEIEHIHKDAFERLSSICQESETPEIIVSHYVSQEIKWGCVFIEDIMKAGITQIKVIPMPSKVDFYPIFAICSGAGENMKITVLSKKDALDEGSTLRIGRKTALDIIKEYQEELSPNN